MAEIATLELPKVEPPRARWPERRTAVPVMPRASCLPAQPAGSNPTACGARARAERLGMLALGTLGGGTWLLIGLLEVLSTVDVFGFFRWGFLAMTPIGVTAGIVAGSWAGRAVTPFRAAFRYFAATLFLLAAPAVSLVSLFLGTFLGVLYVMLRLSFF